MIIAAWAALILILAILVFGSIRKQKLILNKPMIIGAVIAIGVLVINGQINVPNQSVITSYQNTKRTPPYSDAPDIGQTASRAYYITSYKTDAAGNPTLTSFYYYDKKWQKADKPLPFLKDEIKITRRSVE